MKARKGMIFFIAVMTALLVSGCNDNVQTEEEIVTPKQEEEAEDAGDLGGQEEGVEGTDENGEGIAQQVQAPETYVWEENSDTISVKVNAPVIVPKGEGFKTFQVTARTYTQEDYDRISQTILKGATLWDRDYEQMEKSHGFTREEIDEAIANFEANKANGGKYENTGKNVDYDEVIREWEALREGAPEEAIIIDVPSVVSYSPGEEYSEENRLSGYATVDGENYLVSVDNNLRDDWRWITFEVSAERSKGNFTPVVAGDETGVDVEQFPIKELKDEAEKMMADMGFTEFTAAGDEFFRTYAWNEELEALSEYNQDGYGLHFTRTLEGIPVTYTNSEGTAMENNADTSWPYEKLDIIFDTEGIADFKWSNPYSIEKLSDETVFLIPFSDIQGIFQEMIFKKYDDFLEASDVELSLEIDEVHLGYMRVMDKGNVMEGTMIPVWDFFGSETICNHDGETYTNNAPYTSCLTINAIDGTIIDRDLGY
ncbi:DUF6034 family protein [Parablautia muri]|uniref:DUF6034 family protein n=1 Tax=Parablautia muri TaxID=2320879 RepID=UPI00136D6CCD